MQVDHIIPQRLGGISDINNCNPVCKRCNHKIRTEIQVSENGEVIKAEFEVNPQQKMIFDLSDKLIKLDKVIEERNAIIAEHQKIVLDAIYEANNVQTAIDTIRNLYK